MRLHKVFKTATLLLLMFALVFSLAGCYKDPGPPIVGKLENQRINWRYYFQQGYRDDWSANYDLNDEPIEPSTKKLFEMYPTEYKDKALYSIYKDDTGQIIITVLEVMKSIMKEDHKLYFNKKFSVEEEERQDFKFTSEDKKVIYNKNQFRTASYSFTKDGEEWLGDMYLLMDGQQYYMITWEREASLKSNTEISEQFLESIDDFNKTGFEDDDK